jgi:multiple sugar transport system permease protein
VAIPLSIAIPLFIACILFNVSGGGWLKTLFMSPLVIPSACVAFFFQSLFMSNGLLSRILEVNTDWLLTEHSFAIAIGLYIWKTMGFNLILALAGLANIPNDYYEWAAVEGMGKVRMFFKITLVYLIPSMFIIFVMSFINSFKVYRELYMLAGNYPNENIYMLQHYMNNQFARLNYQNLTTAAFVATLVITVFMIGFFIVDKKAEFGE